MYFDSTMYLTQIALLAVWVFVCAGIYTLVDKFIIGGYKAPEEPQRQVEE
jgi:hypothetical protein